MYRLYQQYAILFLAITLSYSRPFGQQRIGVTVKAEEPTEILVVPNPSRPTESRVPPGEFYTSHSPDGRTWTKADSAGVIFTIRVIPGVMNFTESSFKIFDSYGTVVAARDDPIQIPASWVSTDSSAYNYDIYWNGSKPNGDFVHPGIYTATLTYAGGGKTIAGTFFMEKPLVPVKSNACGTGYLIALIPPIGFRARRHFLRFFNDKNARA